jgi:hypothetical protein
VLQLFSDHLAVVLDCLALQDKNNIRKLSIHIKLICTQCQRFAFILSDNVGLLYMYPVIGDNLCFIIHGILYLHIHTL